MSSEEDQSENTRQQLSKNDEKRILKLSIRFLFIGDRKEPYGQAE